jgi:TolA-binding protein
LQLRPGASVAAHGLANLTIAYAKTGQMDAARRRLQELNKLKPDATLLYPTLRNTADAAFAGGDKAWAAEIYGQLSKATNAPEYVKLGLAGLAKCQVQTANLSPAEATLERMIQQYPDDAKSAEAAILRGRLLEQENRLDAALGMYRLVIESYPKSAECPQALLAAARLYDKLKQDEYAATMYERFVREYPSAPEIDAAIYGWAWVLRDLNKPDKADEQFTRLYREFPKSAFWADATFRLAEQASANRKFDTADSLLSALLNAQTDPNLRLHALYVYGQNAVAAEQWAQVAPRLSKLLTEYPNSPLSLPAEYWVAEAEFRQAKYDKAGERFNALADKIKGRQDRWLALVPLRRAQILAHERKWEAAAKVAATIETEFAGFEQQYEADYLLGRCYASLADFKAARESYQKVLRSRTGGKSETSAMAQWMIGETYFHQQQYEAALREYQSVGNLFAVEFPRWQAAALLQSGKCQEQLQRPTEAAEAYGRVLQAFGNTEFAAEAKTRLAALQTKPSLQAARPNAN